MRYLAIALTFLMFGCATAPVETQKLRAPSAWMMAQPCSQPKIPSDEANPSVRAGYYANSRKCAAKSGDQVRGLQRYIRTVRANR